MVHKRLMEPPGILPKRAPACYSGPGRLKLYGVNVLLHMFLLLCGPCTILNSMNLPHQTQQVVLVTTPSWDSQTGTLQVFKRAHGAWVPAEAPISVNVGRGPQKMEGDGRAPAGIFKLESVFGYGATAPTGSRLPYRSLGETDFWDSDSASKQYNQLVTLSDADAQHPESIWSSYEKMRRSDDLYEFGMIVGYNRNPAVGGKGSAIFLHVWRGSGSPTSGCTSMPRESLLSLIGWLDPAKHPLLIQAPAAELDKIRFSK